MKYTVRVTETSTKDVEVLASSQEEAIDMVERRWNDSDIILTADDFDSVDLSVVLSEATDAKEVATLYANSTPIMTIPLREATDDMYCARNHPVKVLHSAAGWYIGTTAFDEGLGCEVPNCRLSTGYWPTEHDARLALANQDWCFRAAAENIYCAGPGTPCIKDEQHV